MCRSTDIRSYTSFQAIPSLQEPNLFNPDPRLALSLASTSTTSPTAFSVSLQTDYPIAAPFNQVNRVQLTERQMFLLFIKVLLKYLHKNNEPILRGRVVAIISECVQRNRKGEIRFSPLDHAIKLLLRKYVGEVHWMRAKLCVEAICRKKNWQSSLVETV